MLGCVRGNNIEIKKEDMTPFDAYNCNFFIWHITSDMLQPSYIIFFYHHSRWQRNRQQKEMKKNGKREIEAHNVMS